MTAPADSGNQGRGPRRAGLSHRLPRPCLMLVTDRRLAGGEDGLVRAVDEAIDGGVNVVQLREKYLDVDALTALAIRLREVTGDRAILTVNGDVVVVESRADGVHLPESAPLPEGTEGLIVGRSIHSVDGAERVAAEGADYLVAGPIYQTKSHPGVAPAGVDLIRKVTEAVSIPVIGIGGIDRERAPEVMRAGAAGVAVISGILGTGRPCEAATRLWGALEGAQA